MSSTRRAPHSSSSARAATSNDAIVQPVNPGIAIDGVKIRRAFATPDYGYVVLHRVSQGWTGTVYSQNDEVLARCRLHGRQLVCRSISR